jgi:glycosyltransferase involved in cell wall biosynthesis
MISAHPISRILAIDAAPFIGGAQMSFLSTLQELSRRGFDLLLATASPQFADLAKLQDIPTQLFNARHWPTTPLGACKYVMDKLNSTPILNKLIRDFKPEIIHANAIRSILILPKIKHIPILLHDRDYNFPNTFVKIAKQKFKHNLTIAAISPLVAEKWRGIIDENRLNVLYNGFYLQEIENTIPIQLPKDKFSIIIAADFVKWKRHDRFIEAIKKLNRKDIRAIIKARHRNDDLELSKNIHDQTHGLQYEGIFDFNVNDEPALPYIAAADLLVSCSENEPFGRTIVEALTLGKPVVVCKGTGLDEILAESKAATLVDPIGLPNAINDWLDRQKLKDMEQHARNTAKQFNIKPHADHLIGIYQNMTYS